MTLWHICKVYQGRMWDHWKRKMYLDLLVSVWRGIKTKSVKEIWFGPTIQLITGGTCEDKMILVLPAIFLFIEVLVASGNTFTFASQFSQRGSVRLAIFSDFDSFQRFSGLHHNVPCSCLPFRTRGCKTIWFTIILKFMFPDKGTNPNVPTWW